MKNYLDLLKDVMENGQDTIDRTGVGTRSIIGAMLKYDLSKGFPAPTTKALAMKAMVAELIWMMSGSCDERRLAEIQYEKPREEIIGKKTIWTANADAQGVELGLENNDLVKDLGSSYGKMFRNIETSDGESIDQIKNLIENIKTNPYSRRNIINLWHVPEIPSFALPPCHVMSAWSVRDGKLNCTYFMRSTDLFLGLIFDNCFYSMLIHVLARITGLEPGQLCYMGNDCHIYNNHFEQVKEQLSREPYPLPELVMPEFTTLEEFLETRPSQYSLKNYQHHPRIPAPMAV